jgi:hypothetical protein
MMGSRLIRIRYDGSCGECRSPLAVGQRGWWDGGTKSLRCEGCGAAAQGIFESEYGRRAGVPGGSARAQFEQRRARHEQSVRARHPLIGGVKLALTKVPQSIRAWEQGAIGEHRVGGLLERLRERDVVVLHDRRLPGTRGNIDHIVVANSGVWVIDTKHYHGRIERRDVGGWFRRDERLYIDGRDRTQLVVEMEKQLDAVRRVLAGANLSLHPVLCFTGGEWSLFAKPFAVDGVCVTWPKSLVATIERAPNRGVATADVAVEIAKRLPALS